MDMRPVAQRVLNTLEKTLRLGVSDPRPSSFWNEEMSMLNDDDLPLDLRIYSSWHEFTERFHKGWILYAPYHVFRLASENSFVLGHRNKEWLVYDTTNKTTKKMKNGIEVVVTYPSFQEAILTFGE